MDKIPPVQFLFRKPKYPVIVDIDGVVVCGRSAITLAKRLSRLINLQEKSYDAIDSTGEGWSFHSDKWILSPLCITKRWSKGEIIRLYNNRINKISNHDVYSEKSLSSKRLDRVFNEIFELLNKT
jgi:hypothetical protein